MHVAQPMIVLWFLRRWRGMAIALGIYDLFLVASILMLEQHYVIDVLAGLLVGAVAIAITGGPFRVRTSNSSGVERPGEPMNRMA
jgi:membrane-associated phospholipid phosphatase